MNNGVPFRKDDQQAIMSLVGTVLPPLFREAVDDGFHRYAKSRSLDPEAHVEYGKSCRANMLYERIAATTRYLIDGAKASIPDLRYKITDNQRATEIMLGPYLCFRLKRIKRNRKNLTTGVWTRRNGFIRSPSPHCQSVGQTSFPFPDDVDFIPPEYRVWVTVAWDLDELEESVSRVVIGAETRKRWFWLQPLSPVDTDVIASFPALLADRIQEVRQRRAS